MTARIPISNMRRIYALILALAVLAISAFSAGMAENDGFYYLQIIHSASLLSLIPSTSILFNLLCFSC